MPKNAKAKREARARKALTGESYTTARVATRSLGATPMSPSSSLPVPVDAAARRAQALHTVTAYWAQFLRAPGEEAPQVGTGAKQAALDVAHAVLVDVLPTYPPDRVAAFEVALFNTLDSWGDRYYVMQISVDYKPPASLTEACTAAGITDDMRFHFPSKTYTEIRADWTVYVREGQGAKPRILPLVGSKE